MIPGLSRFTQVVLHQGWIEGYFNDYLKANDGAIPERGVMPESLKIDKSKVEDSDAYPVEVILRHLTPVAADVEQFGHKVENGLFRSTNLVTSSEEDIALKAQEAAEKRERVNAKYVLGCDGAHSWVRRTLGFKMEGESTDYVWGVLDIVPLTNFPDIRHRCAIHSKDHGSVMVIPREGGLVRFYIQLNKVERCADGSVDRTKITPEQILESAQKIMAPYTLTYETIQWFTAYQIGQRVANEFSAHDRVFLAGDACHTHSPKAGQGMNVSMMDQYNLAWKVGAVCQGTLQRSALSTYQYERQQIANDLIAFDRKFAAMFSSKPGETNMDDFKAMFEESHVFAAGVDINYAASNLIAKPGPEKRPDVSASVKVEPSTTTSTQSLATGLAVGKRFASFKVLSQADALPWQSQHLIPSDGRWRFVVFAGNVSKPAQMARVQKLGAYLSLPSSFPTVYTPKGGKWNSFIQTLTIHAAKRWDVELHDFPDALRKEHDYWSVFVDDLSYHEGHGQAYKGYGIDPEVGCVAVVRPDGYVAFVGALEDTEKVEAFFDGCLIKQV